MNKVKVTICAGTTCYLMGASHLQMLEDHLPKALKPFVEIEGTRCLGLCKDDNYGSAPFVRLNDEIMAEANLMKVLERVEQLVRAEE